MCFTLSVSPLSPILLSFSLQLNKERELRKQLEELRSELLPLETQCQELMEKSTKRTTYLSWGLLAYMCAQAGFFARLTFVNYSWDLMEPITYFVTYTTSILCFAYFVITRQVSMCVCVYRSNNTIQIVVVIVFSLCGDALWLCLHNF